MNAPKAHLGHFVKQDLELLRIVGNDIFLGLQLCQCYSKLYTKRSVNLSQERKGEKVHTVHGGTTCLVRIRFLSKKRVKQLPVFGCSKE